MDFPFLLQADLGATLSIVGIQVGLGFAMVVLLGTILGGLIAWLISKLLGFPKPGLVTAFKLVLFTNLIMWGLESVLAIANALLPVQSGALSLQLGMAASAILSLVFGFVIFPIARGILYVYFAKKAYGIDLLKAILFSVILWRSEERRVGKECRSRWSP